jgi:cytochrome c-type biogenesis protein CcmF
MINEIGHYVLVLALGVGLIVSTLPVIGARRNDRALMDIASLGSVLMFLLVGLSFAALTRAYAVSDFSVRNVWENSHSLMPMIYKLTGVWGQSRRLHAALAAHPRVFQRARRHLRPQPA